MAENEMFGWHHCFHGREFEQAPGVGNGQGSLACCSSWGRKESDRTERLNRTKLMEIVIMSEFSQHWCMSFCVFSTILTHIHNKR